MQNYQSTFYQTSGEMDADEDEEKLLPLAINGRHSSISSFRASTYSNGSVTGAATAILPRSNPVSPASYHQSSPWLRTLPSQSIRSVGVASHAQNPVHTSTPAGAAAAATHKAKTYSHF